MLWDNDFWLDHPHQLTHWLHTERMGLHFGFRIIQRYCQVPAQCWLCFTCIPTLVFRTLTGGRWHCNAFPMRIWKLCHRGQKACLRTVRQLLRNLGFNLLPLTFRAVIWATYSKFLSSELKIRGTCLIALIFLTEAWNNRLLTQSKPQFSRM